MSSTESLPSPTPPSAPPSRPGLIRRTFRRHWIGMFAFWVLGTATVGYLAYQYVKPTYKAVSLLRVEPTPIDLFNVKPNGDPIELFLQTQVKLITSPNVLTAAGANPKAAVLERIQKAGDVVQELEKVVSASIIPETYLIKVSMISSDGKEAATIVNAVVDAFIEANSEWSDGMTRQQIKNLEQYSVDLKNQTDELERKWKTLAAKEDLAFPVIGDPKNEIGRVSIPIEEYRQVRQELNKVKMDLVEAQAWLTTAKAAIAKAGNKDAPAEEQERIDKQVERRFKLDPEVVATDRKVMQEGTSWPNITDAGQIAPGPENPAVKAAKRKYDGLLTQYKQLWDTKSQAIREQIELGGGGVKGTDPAQEIREATVAVNKLVAKQVSLKTQFDSLDVKNRLRATDLVEIALIQDERATLKGMQVAVTRRLEQLRYEAKGEARIRPVNPNGAMVPNRPISDHRGLVLGIIPLAMLFPAFGLFVGVEAFSVPRARPAKEQPTREV